MLNVGLPVVASVSSEDVRTDVEVTNENTDGSYYDPVRSSAKLLTSEGSPQLCQFPKLQ